MTDCSINYNIATCKSLKPQLNEYNLPNYWKPYKYKSSIDYAKYYYYFYDKPYFVSNYITPHKFLYDPTLKLNNRKIKLDDGTLIEPFNYNNKFVIHLIFIFIFIFVFVFILLTI